MEKNIDLKEKLYSLCFEWQTKKVDDLKKAMDDAQESANSEEKSTAGDKYDTARAMSQNVRDMNARQLQEALKDLGVLQQIKSDQKYSFVKTGSLVISSAGNYFISISLGELKVEGTVIFAISAISPLAQILLNKKEGDKVNFRGKDILIKEIY